MEIERRRVISKGIMMIGLTIKQNQILEWIIDYQKRNGISPTLKEIGKRVRRSKVTVFEHLSKLEEKGFITREKNQTRNIRIVPRSSEDLSNFRTNDLIRELQGRGLEI